MLRGESAPKHRTVQVLSCGRRGYFHRLSYGANLKLRVQVYEESAATGVLRPSYAFEPRGFDLHLYASGTSACTIVSTFIGRNLGNRTLATEVTVTFAPETAFLGGLSPYQRYSRTRLADCHRSIQ